MFAKAGFRVALIARGADKLKKVAEEVAASATGAEVSRLTAPVYNPIGNEC